MQVDGAGKAWVAGNTYSALDGNENAGKYDIFVMTFDGDGNHLWTQQRGGARSDYANALQVDSGFRCCGSGSYASQTACSSLLNGPSVREQQRIVLSAHPLLCLIGCTSIRELFAPTQLPL